MKLASESDSEFLHAHNYSDSPSAMMIGLDELSTDQTATAWPVPVPLRAFPSFPTQLAGMAAGVGLGLGLGFRLTMSITCSGCFCCFLVMGVVFLYKTQRIIWIIPKAKPSVFGSCYLEITIVRV